MAGDGRTERPRYNPEAIRRLFDDMAATYGRVNVISSFGFTARWRHQVVAGLPLESATSVVDLMSGMGELWRTLSRSVPESARVLGVDLSPEMARRTRRDWRFSADVLVADALECHFEEGSADGTQAPSRELNRTAGEASIGAIEAAGRTRKRSADAIAPTSAARSRVGRCS